MKKLPTVMLSRVGKLSPPDYSDLPIDTYKVPEIEEIECEVLSWHIATGKIRVRVPNENGTSEIVHLSDTYLIQKYGNPFVPSW